MKPIWSNRHHPTKGIIPGYFLVWSVATVVGFATTATAQTTQPAAGPKPAANATAQTTRSGSSARIDANATAQAGTAGSGAADTANVERVTLDEALLRAMRRNPSAQSAALELDRAEALVRQARATSLPTLTGNATYTRLDNDRVLANRIIAAENQFNANVVLSVPLIAPGRWMQWSHAKDDAAVVTLSGEDLRRQLAISVARTFLSVVSQHRVVEANQLALDASKAHELYANERLAGGVGKRIDAVRASQQVASNEAALERARVALARSMEALGVLMGEERPIDAAVDPELEGAPDVAAAAAGIEQRGDLSVARARRDAARKRWRDSWVDFLPTLTGQFQPFYQSPATLTTPRTGWQALLVLTVPFYDGGARYGARDERRVLSEQAELSMSNLMRQARSEVRIAFEATRSADAALESAQRAAQLAHDAQQMATLAYEAGALTNLEVIDAERQARDADTAVAVAEDTLRQARLDLLIASGKFPAKR